VIVHVVPMPVPRHVGVPVAELVSRCSRELAAPLPVAARPRIGRHSSSQTVLAPQPMRRTPSISSTECAGVVPASWYAWSDEEES
jgi:hypothetical protein